MAEAVYVLCGLTSALCAGLLLRGYRRSGTRLLLWSGLCFLGLTLNNILLFVDLVVVPTIDLSLWRGGTAVVGMAMLLWGLVGVGREA
jgi:hypothetical protein